MIVFHNDNRSTLKRGQKIFMLPLPTSWIKSYSIGRSDGQNWRVFLALKASLFGVVSHLYKFNLTNSWTQKLWYKPTFSADNHHVQALFWLCLSSGHDLHPLWANKVDSFKKKGKSRVASIALGNISLGFICEDWGERHELCSLSTIFSRFLTLSIIPKHYFPVSCVQIINSLCLPILNPKVVI